MPNFISFTLHAKERLVQRSGETIESIIKIIENQRYVPIGSETSSNRVHYLFFSKIDQLHHVIIIDEKTGEVITILPIDFHHNISWSIDERALKLAETLAERKSSLKPRKGKGHVYPSTFRICVIYREEWNTPKMMGLGSWPFDHRVELEEFVPTAKFWEEVSSRSAAKNRKLEDCDAVMISRGKDLTNPIIFEIPLK